MPSSISAPVPAQEDSSDTTSRMAAAPRKSSADGSCCLVCKNSLPAGDLIPAAAVPPAVAKLIGRDFPHWKEDAWICPRDLRRYHLEHVRLDLGEGCGVISDLESDVLQSLTADQVLAEELNRQYERKISRSGRFAQLLTAAAGSWSFLTSFTLIVAAWIAVGSAVLPGRSPDLFAFIVLNTVLSGICALQAPVVLMGFRQHEERQHLQAEIEYKRSLKAEVLARQLAEKLDHLLTLQARLVVATRSLNSEESASSAGSAGGRAPLRPAPHPARPSLAEH